MQHVAVTPKTVTGGALCLETKMTDPILTPEVYGDDHQNPNGLVVAKATAESAEKPERRKISGTGFVSASYRAHQISDDCMAAYWLDLYAPDAVDYRRKSAENNLRQLADLFGFDLVAK